MNQNYSFFLFSKLFDVYHPREIEYDWLFEEVEWAYIDYNKSKYNDSNKAEYQCICDYLSNYLPKI